MHKSRDEALEYVRMILRLPIPAPVGDTYDFGPVRVTVMPNHGLRWERLTWADCTDVDARGAIISNPFER